MATVQDYLNMAVSMTIGNKSGTNNQVLLPDDFRKFENLRVKEFKVTKAVYAANDPNKNLPRDDAADSIFLVFFSHPVNVTHINDNGLGGDGLFTSFVALGRNLEGTANFGGNPVKFSNTLKSPTFTEITAVVSEMAEVEALVVNIKLAA